MSLHKPFLSSEAKDALPPGVDGDFILPLCLPEPNLLVGEMMAMLIFETVEGQRVGVPIGVETLADLHRLLGDALRSMQVPEGGTVQ